MSSRQGSTAIDGSRRYSTRSSAIKEKDEDFYPPSCPIPKRYPPNSSRSSRTTQSSRGSGGGRTRRNSTVKTGSSRSGTRSGSSTKGDSRRSSVIQKYLPPDPRPSKADPEERERRKQYEKAHGGFDWTDGVELALAGAVTLFGIEKALSKSKK